jgi:hypothetical protein
MNESISEPTSTQVSTISIVLNVFFFGMLYLLLNTVCAECVSGVREKQKTIFSTPYKRIIP